MCNKVNEDTRVVGIPNLSKRQKQCSDIINKKCNSDKKVYAAQGIEYGKDCELCQMQWVNRDEQEKLMTPKYRCVPKKR